MDILKRPIGKQDHYAAAFGSINFFKFYSNGNVSIRPIDETSQYTQLIFNSLVTFYTHQNRDASKILSYQEKRTNLNKTNLLLIRENAEDLYKQIYLKKLSVKKFGEILDNGWKVKKQLSKKVSNKLIDDAYNSAKKMGVYGGKLSGAGGGGFLNFVVKKDLKSRLILSLSKKKIQYFPIKLDSIGSIIL